MNLIMHRLVLLMLTCSTMTTLSYGQNGFGFSLGVGANFLKTDFGGGMKSLELESNFFNGGTIALVEADNSYGGQLSLSYGWKRSFVETTWDYRFRRFSIRLSDWNSETETWTSGGKPDKTFWLNSRHIPILFNKRIIEHKKTSTDLFLGVGLGYYVSELNIGKRNSAISLTNVSNDYSVQLDGEFWRDQYFTANGDITANVQVLAIHNLDNGSKLGLRLLLTEAYRDNVYYDGIKFKLTARTTRGNEGGANRTFWLQQNSITLMFFYRPARFTLNANQD